MKNVSPSTTKKLTIVFDREEDGRVIAEIPSIPGVLAYGATKSEARRRVKEVAFCS